MRRSSRLVTLLAAAVVGVLFLAGLAVSGRAGGVMLAAVAVVLVVLSSATWPRLSSRARAMRGAVLLVVAGIALAKLAGAS